MSTSKRTPPAGEKPARAKPAGDDGGPEARVLRQFRLVFNSVKTHFQQMEKLAGVGGAQVWALAIIRDQPGVGVNQLARAMDVRQPTASNLVKALSAQGHIEVRKEGADRRAVQLHLLAAGARVLRRAPGPFHGVLPQALAALDPTTLRRLEQDLGLLIRALNADEDAGDLLLSQM
jgi:DNA-binding MarR family transcriptional regulator